MSKIGAYIHAKPDGTPFYVGKGTPYRMNLLQKNRNKWFLNIVNKYGEDNIIKTYYECSNEQLALELEVGLIKILRANGYELCNLTNGGEGISGYKYDKAIVERIRQKNLGRVQPEEERKMRSKRLKGIYKKPHTEEHKTKIGSKIKGRRWYNNGKNVVFCHEGEQPKGYVFGRKNTKLLSEKMEKVKCHE